MFCHKPSKYLTGLEQRKKNEISEISFNLYVCHLKGPYYRENNMSSSTNERDQVTFEFQDFIKALSLFLLYIIVELLMGLQYS